MFKLEKNIDKVVRRVIRLLMLNENSNNMQ